MWRQHIPEEAGVKVSPRRLQMADQPGSEGPVNEERARGQCTQEEGRKPGQAGMGGETRGETTVMKQLLQPLHSSRSCGSFHTCWL